MNSLWISHICEIHTFSHSDEIHHLWNSPWIHIKEWIHNLWILWNSPWIHHGWKSPWIRTELRIRNMWIYCEFQCEFTPICAPTFILSCETITPLHKKTNSRCGHTVERQITYLLTHSLTHLELTIYLLTYTEQRSIQHEPQQRMGQTNNWLYAADFVRTELSNVVWSFVSDALFQVGVRLIDIVNRSLPLQPQICNLYIK